MVKRNVYTLGEGGGFTKTAAVLVVIILTVAVSVALWIFFSRSNNQEQNKSTKIGQNNKPTDKEKNNTGGVSSLITYTLPADWTDSECIGANNTVLVIPAGKQKPLDCATGQKDWPIKIYADTTDTKDCEKITANNQQVSKHICRSLFLDGHKTLQVSTEYNDKSSYSKATRVSAYYINTGDRVAKLEYIDNLTVPDDDFQAGFEELVQSVKVKST